ncbi:MAG TPA: LuxR C-terminal-related transcriptional regulator [Longimicrobiaceae bacterium]|nr:LuxR C-terminal-related transcriptional regulator [Longimicrobiaceae bacterium]
MRPVSPTVLRDTLETLLTPAGPDLDDWRDSVCQSFRNLIGADVVFFRLSDSGPSRIDPVGNLECRDVYRRHFRPLDPWLGYAVKPGETRIDSYEGVIGANRIRHDSYYNDFIKGYGLQDYIGVQIGTTPGAHAHLGVFNLERSRGTDYRADTLLRLRMVLAAYQSGLRVWITTRGQSDGIGQILDSLADPLLLCDAAGRVMHANTAMVTLLASDPASSDLRRVVEDAARDLARARTGSVGDLVSSTRAREITTSRGTYKIRSVVADSNLTPFGGVLLIVDRIRREPPDDSILHEHFGLTNRETQVARLLARGSDNDEIAAELGIGCTTARNHTAHVLGKLRVSSRAQVHTVLHP